VIASLCRRFSKTNCGASFYRFEIPFANFFQASSRAKMGQPAHHAPLFALAFFIHCFSCARVRPVIASHHRTYTERGNSLEKIASDALNLHLHLLRRIFTPSGRKFCANCFFEYIYPRPGLEICIIRHAQFAQNFKLEQNSQGGTAGASSQRNVLSSKRLPRRVCMSVGQQNNSRERLICMRCC